MSVAGEVPGDSGAPQASKTKGERGKPYTGILVPKAIFPPATNQEKCLLVDSSKAEFLSRQIPQEVILLFAPTPKITVAKGRMAEPRARDFRGESVRN